MGMRTTFSAQLRVGFHTTFLGISYWASVNARIARHFNHTRLRRHSPKNKKRNALRCVNKPYVQYCIRPAVSDAAQRSCRRAGIQSGSRNSLKSSPSHDT